MHERSPTTAADLPIFCENEGYNPSHPYAVAGLNVRPGELPVFYEDEGQDDMGESLAHTDAEAILRFGLMSHFAARPGHAVLPNMNLYYHPTDPGTYISPDVMVVTPPAPLPTGLRSYRVGETGPAPVLTVEVLSRRTFQQGDLTLKPVLYADLGVREYLLVDATGALLPERLLLKSGRVGHLWMDYRDQGAGVESREFGFGVRVEADGGVRVYNAKTGHPYARPAEAEAEARARRKEAAARRKEAAARQAAEARVRELEAELAKLRGQAPPAE
jgi:hypothetical protein